MLETKVKTCAICTHGKKSAQTYTPQFPEQVQKDQLLFRKSVDAGHQEWYLPVPFSSRLQPVGQILQSNVVTSAIAKVCVILYNCKRHELMVDWNQSPVQPNLSKVPFRHLKCRCRVF